MILGTVFIIHWPYCVLLLNAHFFFVKRQYLTDRFDFQGDPGSLAEPCQWLDARRLTSQRSMVKPVNFVKFTMCTEMDIHGKSSTCVLSRCFVFSHKVCHVTAFTARICSLREGNIFGLFVCPLGGTPWSCRGPVQGKRGGGVPQTGLGGTLLPHIGPGFDSLCCGRFASCSHAGEDFPVPHRQIQDLVESNSIGFLRFLFWTFIAFYDQIVILN